jgi:hypothetical protein
MVTDATARVGKDSAQHKHNYSLPPASGLVRKLKSAVLFVCGLPGPPLPPWSWASKALMAVLLVWWRALAKSSNKHCFIYLKAVQNNGAHLGDPG